MCLLTNLHGSPDLPSLFTSALPFAGVVMVYIVKADVSQLRVRIYKNGSKQMVHYLPTYVGARTDTR
jgi:hypothetical protein